MKAALLPGSFDPLTLGHIDLIERSSSLCDLLYVAVGNNINKKYLFTLEQRITFLQDQFSKNKNIKIISFDSLIVSLCESLNCYTIIKGLRNNVDYIYEQQMAVANKTLNSKIETVFLSKNQNTEHISSTLVKEIAQFKGKIASFVTPEVAKLVIKIFK